jgi:imidazolonepropionase-like amidohydrolase
MKLVAAFFLCVSLLNSQSTPIAITGVTLIDGTGAPAIRNANIVIQDGRIRGAGPASKTKVPAGAEVVDGRGKWVIPGLVDLHVHPPATRAEAEGVFDTYLHYGVTTVRSLGVDGGDIWQMREDQRAGKLKAPRIFTAGQGFGHPHGWPNSPNVLRPTTEAEAREAVRNLAGKRVDLVKMWVDTKSNTLPKFDLDVARAIIDEAKRHGIPSAAHVFDYSDAETLVKFGISELIHMVRDRNELPSEFVRALKAGRVSITPTMAKMEGDYYFYERPDHPQLRDPDYRALMGDKLMSRLMGPPESSAEVLAERKREFERAQRFTKQLSDAGILVAVGSDGPVFPVAHGYGTHVEMRVLNRAGLTPLEAIRAATLNGAKRLTTGLNGKGKRDFGTIEPGMAADLVLLSADPLIEIENTRKIEAVMQSGRWIERNKVVTR